MLQEKFDVTDIWPWLETRFVLVGDCWQWTGAVSHGYGRAILPVRFVQGLEIKNAWPAHRLVYFVLVGSVAPELDLHHECRNRACINPDHLLPVTRKRHIELEPRDITAMLQWNKENVPTHCPRNHPYNEVNTVYKKDGNRRCLICHRDQERIGARRRRGSRLPLDAPVTPKSLINRKLTLEQVRHIRELEGIETHQAIASKFGVAKSTITTILTGRTWKIP